MTYLLDTHYILWSLFEPEKIKPTARGILENDDIKFVSGVNLWEISLRYALGKLELGGKTPNEVLEGLLEMGFDVAELDSQLLATYYRLPKKENHRDPFDHLLVWQAISNGYTLLTQDSRIGQYQKDGLRLKVI